MADPSGAMPRYVVVSRPPAAGKSTLARELAQRLNRPLIAKGTIKDALLLALGARDLESSREIGAAAVDVLVAVAREAPSAVLASVWHVSRAREALGTLEGPIVEVFCKCDQQTLAARYKARAHSRPAGHFDTQRTATELWNDQTSQPAGGGWPVIEIDTTRPVDLDNLVSSIHGRDLSAR